MIHAHSRSLIIYWKTYMYLRVIRAINIFEILLMFIKCFQLNQKSNIQWICGFSTEKWFNKVSQIKLLIHKNSKS